MNANGALETDRSLIRKGESMKNKIALRLGLLVFGAVTAFALIIAQPTAAATLHVPGDYGTIQAAIDAASPGDQIEVAAGTYYEAINFIGKAIRLYSSGGQAVTFIDATGLDSPVVTCVSGEGADTILEGFTITGGAGTQTPLGKWGGGMYNYASSPTVINCTFFHNTPQAGGGGMANVGSSPTVTDCTFSDNTAGAGGGMFNGELGVVSSEPRVSNCVFIRNAAAWGGGMWNYMSNATVINCTFSNNTGPIPGMYNEYYSHPTVTNSILWGNGSGAQIIDVFGSSAVVTYTDVQNGYPGTGNIDADPMFRDAPNADYRLLSGSPCIDAGDNAAVPADLTKDLEGNPRIFNSIVDMGAYEYTAFVQVQIDIKPGSYPNAINLGSNGVVPVAILSSADFDAASVDTQTVTLGGANVAVRGKGSKELAAFEDIDGDGRLDLVVHVVTDNLLPGLFQDGFAILEGRTFDGNAIRGQDEIVVVPVQ